MDVFYGDGVFYHGSLKRSHGLYTVVWADSEGERFTLSSEGETLRGVHRGSFEVLVTVDGIGWEGGN